MRQYLKRAVHEGHRSGRSREGPRSTGVGIGGGGGGGAGGGDGGGAGGEGGGHSPVLQTLK